MSTFIRLVLLVCWLLFPAAVSWAQDAFGHWTGALNLPTGELALEIDLAKTANGAVIGTVGQPAQQVKGLPLAKVVIEGQAVSFDLPGANRASFSGTVSPDGTSLTGNVSGLQGSLPVTFTRTGEAKIAAPPVSAPISKQLEGTWSGTLDAMGRQMHLTLTLLNHPDKTSSGTLASVDEGGLTLPVAIEQHGADVTIDTPATHAGFKGTLDAAGSTLTGTFSQAGLSLPLTFKRDASK